MFWSRRSLRSTRRRDFRWQAGRRILHVAFNLDSSAVHVNALTAGKARFVRCEVDRGADDFAAAADAP